MLKDGFCHISGMYHKCFATTVAVYASTELAKCVFCREAVMLHQRRYGLPSMYLAHYARSCCVCITLYTSEEATHLLDSGLMWVLSCNSAVTYRCNVMCTVSIPLCCTVGWQAVLPASWTVGIRHTSLLHTMQPFQRREDATLPMWTWFCRSSLQTHATVPSV